MSDTAMGRRPAMGFRPDESEAAGAGARELAARPVAPGRLAYGLSAALAAAATIVTRRRVALAGGYLAGLILVGWIVVQVLVLQRFFFLQPVIAVLGLAEIALAWLWQRAGTGGPVTTGTFASDRRGRPAATVNPGSDVPADNRRGARAEGQR